MRKPNCWKLSKKKSWKQSEKRDTLHKTEQRKIANFLIEKVQARRQCNAIFKGKKMQLRILYKPEIFKK